MYSFSYLEPVCLVPHKSLVLISYYVLITSRLSLDFPCDWDSKESTCNGFIPWVGKILWRRAWQPFPVFLPGELPWQRSLAGYSPWGHKELDKTELLSTHTQAVLNWISRAWLSIYSLEPNQLQGSQGLNPILLVLWYILHFHHYIENEVERPSVAN